MELESITKETVKASGLHVSDQEAQNVASFINGLLERKPAAAAAAAVEEDRPCGKESGPCCGGRCG